MAKQGYNSSEIAKLANVSRSTVSRVINNNGYVHPKTRQKVADVLARYSYAPSLPAKVLAGGKTHFMGMFMRTDNTLVEEYVLEMQIVVIMQAASRMGYVIVPCMVSDYDSPENKRVVKDFFLQKRIDTAVFSGTHIKEPLIYELAEAGYRFGVTDQLVPEMPEGVAVLNASFYECARAQIEYLNALGHRDIALLCGDMRRYSGKHKRQGNIDAMIELGIGQNPAWIRDGSFTERSGFERAQAILQSGHIPTAFCCANDSIAYGTMNALKQAGLRVPQDVSVLGMDNLDFSRYISPGLTTFDVRFRQLVESITMEAILSQNPDHVPLAEAELGFERVERASCAPIA